MKANLEIDELYAVARYNEHKWNLIGTVLQDIVACQYGYGKYDIIGKDDAWRIGRGLEGTFIVTKKEVIQIDDIAWLNNIIDELFKYYNK